MAHCEASPYAAAAEMRIRRTQITESIGEKLARENKTKEGVAARAIINAVATESRDE